jgi:hypothetical protein
MSVRKLNVRTCDLDESLERAGFRHVAASIGERVGAERLGAAVYEAQAGYPIWPYHYHHAVEEWIYSGERVSRRQEIVVGSGQLFKSGLVSVGRILAHRTPGSRLGVSVCEGVFNGVPHTEDYSVVEVTADDHHPDRKSVKCV